MKRITEVSRVLTLSLLCLFVLAGCKETKEQKTAEEKPAQKTENTIAEQKGAAADAGFSFAGLPDTVATVNGQKVEKKTLEKIYSVMSRQFMMTGQKMDDKELVDLALNELISAELLKQESARRKLTPPDSKVEEKLESIRSRFPSPEAFEQAMKENKMDMATLKSEIKDQLALEALVKDEVESKVNVKDEEIAKFYKENPDDFKTEESIKASHVLVKVEEGADEAKTGEAKQKIEKVLGEVKKGGDFASLAKQYSECPSAPSGGDLGYFPKGQMVKPFEEAAFALKKGEVSGIVRTEFGFHIIKLTDKKAGGVKPLSEARESIKAFLSQTEGKKLFTAYLEKLRAAASISKNI